MLAETMVQENSSQDSSDECSGANDHCCNAYSSTCADGSICADSGQFIIYKIQIISTSILFGWCKLIIIIIQAAIYELSMS